MSLTKDQIMGQFAEIRYLVLECSREFEKPDPSLDVIQDLTDRYKEKVDTNYINIREWFYDNTDQISEDMVV